MTHTYQIFGMTCDNCVQKVKETLEKLHGIQVVQTMLEPPSLDYFTRNRHILLIF